MLITITAVNERDFRLIERFMESTGYMISTSISTLAIEIELPKPDLICSMFEEISFSKNVEVSEASYV